MTNITTKLAAVVSLCVASLLLLCPFMVSVDAVDNDQGEYSAYTYTFNFAFEGTNAQSILWDFGFTDENDNRVTSEEWNPRNVTFPAKGTYTVTQTVTNTMGDYVSTLTVHVLGTPEVFFDTDGGSSIPMKYVKAGYPVSRPADPVKEGYTFAGWYIDPDLSLPYNFSIPVSEHISLYAKWAEEGSVIPDPDGDGSGGDGTGLDGPFPTIPVVMGLIGILSLAYGYSKSKKEPEEKSRAGIFGVLLLMIAAGLFMLGVTDLSSLSAVIS